MERVEKLRMLLSEQPADSFLQHALALEYIKQGDDLNAEIVFKELLAADPAYVGSYYHLAKLLERLQKSGEAITVYQTGMSQAKKAGDQHAYNELQNALEDLEDL